MKSNKTTFSRYPSRELPNKEDIYAILDEAKLCHLAYEYEGYPVVIPTIFGRVGDRIFVHGSVKSRTMLALDGKDVCFEVSHLDGLVLARTAFDHSMNYRSVIAYSKARKVTDSDQVLIALEAIINQILPGRWDELDAPEQGHLAATAVFELDLNEATAKKRFAGPGDENKPQKDVWAGVIPMKTEYGNPEPDSFLDPAVPVPQSVKSLIEK